MKILFFGDIVGKIGRQALKIALPALRQKYQPDAVLANVENLAHGKGVTSKTLREMSLLGIDCFTSGNHVWKKEDVSTAIKDSGVNLITPLNDPRTPKGGGCRLLSVGQNKIFVVNLLGRVFIEEPDLKCPFKEIDKILSEQDLTQINGIIVDVHAEATSEKVALGWYLDGRVSAVIGTHTHIPTADCKILPKGTGYITDVGMVGPIDSVLGVNKEVIIEKFLTDSPIVFTIPEQGAVAVEALFLEIDNNTKLTKKIERVCQIAEVS